MDSYERLAAAIGVAVCNILVIFAAAKVLASCVRRRPSFVGNFAVVALVVIVCATATLLIFATQRLTFG